MIELDIDPEVERCLIDAAAERGLNPGAYAGRIVAQAIQHTLQRSPGPADFDVFLDALLIPQGQAPALPDSAYSRESFYQDHD